MKLSIIRAKLFSLIAAFGFVVAFASLGQAQGQRIALLPTKVPLKLSPGQSSAVKSVCVDRHLPGPEYGEIYGHVLTSAQGSQVIVGEGPGRVSMSLTNAIQQKIVRFRGSFDDEGFLEIENIDPKRRAVSFKINNATVLHSKPGSYRDQPVLDTINRTTRNSSDASFESYDKVQKAAWNESGRLRGIRLNLRDNGYLPDGADLQNSPIISALRKFQKENGLRVSGRADSATVERLDKLAEEQYGSLLRSFRADPLNPAESDVSLEILARKFQEEMELSPSGRIDSITVAALHDELDNWFVDKGINGTTFDERLREYKRINGLSGSGNQLSSQLLSQIKSESTGEQLAYQADMFSYGGRFRAIGSGPDIIKSPAERQVLAVQNLYSGSSTSWLDGPTEQYILIGSADGIELHVVRQQPSANSPLHSKYAVDSTVLKNEAAIETMENLVRKQATGKSDGTTRFVHAAAYQPTAGSGRGAFSLQLGDKQVNLSAASHEALFGGDPKAPVPELDNYINSLPATAGEKPRFIIVRDAFAQGLFGRGGGRLKVESKTVEGPQQYGYHESRRHVHPTELASNLKARYGNKADFLLDDELDTGKANAASIPLVTKGADIVAYVAPNDPLEKEKSTKKADYGIVSNISDYLREAGVEVERGYKTSSKTNVVVLTGHKDRQFIDYVELLGRRGVFRDRIVAMASCYEVGDEALNSRVVREHGAKAVVFFDKRLKAQAVESVLFELTQLLKQPSFSPTRLDELLNRSVDRALEKSENAPWQEDIQKMRRSVIQVSQIEFSNRTQNNLG